MATNKMPQKNPWCRDTFCALGTAWEEGGEIFFASLTVILSKSSVTVCKFGNINRIPVTLHVTMTLIRGTT